MTYLLHTSSLTDLLSCRWVNSSPSICSNKAHEGKEHSLDGVSLRGLMSLLYSASLLNSKE